MRGSARSGPPGGQRRDLGGGHRGDRRAPAGERVAVEGGQQLAAAAQVLGAVREQDRGRAGERLEHGRARAAVQHGRVGGEHAPDRLGVGDEHHRRVRPRDADGERVAVAGAAAAQERRRPGDPLDRLQRGGLAGTGRQRHAAHDRRACVYLEGLAAAEAGLRRVPVADGRLVEQPAEVDLLAAEQRGEVDQAALEVAHDHVELLQVVEAERHLERRGGVLAARVGAAGQLGERGELGVEALVRQRRRASRIRRTMRPTRSIFALASSTV